MRCDIDAKALNAELEFLSPVLKDREVQPPSLYCKVDGDRLAMSSFDGFTNLSTSVQVANASDGTVCISPKVFRPLAKLLPKGVATIGDSSERNFSLTWPDGKAILPKARPWLLKPPTGQSTIDYTLPAKTLLEMVKVADFCIDEVAKTKVPGVLLEVLPTRLKLVSSNIYSLAVVERAIEQGAQGTVVLPYAALAGIKGLLANATSVRIAVIADYITVTTDARSLITRASTSPFPNYSAIMPKVLGDPATFHARDLTAAIHRVNLSSDDNPFGQVTLTFTTDSVDVQSDACHETLSANYGGAPYAVTFDMKKLKHLLNATTHDRLTLCTTSPNAPQLFQPHGASDEQFILVPIHKR